MNPESSKIKEICRRHLIIAYIDGELSTDEELELETHVAVCRDCAVELNEQKQLLFALDSALIEPKTDFPIPEEFTKVVVANAESRVAGLRRPQERFKALFVCAALFLLVLLGLGDETGNLLLTFESFGDQIWAVSGFIFNLVHDISIGTAIILRYLCHRVVLSPFVFMAILLIFSTLLTFIASSLVFRPGRPFKNFKGVFFSR